MSQRFTVLRRFATVEEAGELKSKLASSGIQSMVVKEPTTKGSMGGVFLPVRLMVSVSDKKRAQEISDSMVKAKTKGPSSLTRIIVFVLGVLMLLAGIYFIVSSRTLIGGIVLLVVSVVLLGWSVLAFLSNRMMGRR